MSENPPLYDQIASEFGYSPEPVPTIEKTQSLPVITPAEQVSTTANEQDHSNPWFYAGPDADAPVNL